MGGFRKEFRRVSLSSKVLAAWQDPDDAGGGDGAEDADAPSDGLPGWLQLLRRAAARCLPCCAQHQFAKVCAHRHTQGFIMHLLRI